MPCAQFRLGETQGGGKGDTTRENGCEVSVWVPARPGLKLSMASLCSDIETSLGACDNVIRGGQKIEKVKEADRKFLVSLPTNEGQRTF